MLEVIAKYLISPLSKKRGEKIKKMKSFIHATIRLIISLGKFGIMIYTISLVNISLSSSDSFRYLKNGSPILKLSGTYIQDRTNSNIRRKIDNIIKNNEEDLIITWK